MYTEAWIILITAVNPRRRGLTAGIYRRSVRLSITTCNRYIFTNSIYGRGTPPDGDAPHRGLALPRGFALPRGLALPRAPGHAAGLGNQLGAAAVADHLHCHGAEPAHPDGRRPGAPRSGKSCCAASSAVSETMRPTRPPQVIRLLARCLSSRRQLKDGSAADRANNAERQALSTEERDWLRDAKAGIGRQEWDQLKKRARDVVDGETKPVTQTGTPRNGARSRPALGRLSPTLANQLAPKRSHADTPKLIKVPPRPAAPAAGRNAQTPAPAAEVEALRSQLAQRDRQCTELQARVEEMETAAVSQSKPAALSSGKAFRSKLCQSTFDSLSTTIKREAAEINEGVQACLEKQLMSDGADANDADDMITMGELDRYAERATVLAADTSVGTLRH